MTDDTDDEISNRIVNTFTQARELVRAHCPHGVDVTMEMDAMDLLMDYTIPLGPTGLADVLLLLGREDGPKPVDRAEVVSAVGFVLELRGIAAHAP